MTPSYKDWNKHLRETAAWLVKLSNTPGWLEYAKARRDELLADPMYEPLRDLIREAMEPTSSSSPSELVPGSTTAVTGAQRRAR